MTTALLLAMLACGGGEPEAEAPPEGGAEEPATPSPAPAPAPAAEAPEPSDEAPAVDEVPFAYEGWTGEGLPVFRVTAALEASVHARPAGEARGSCSWSAGDELSWTRSVVVTREPVDVALADEVELPRDVTTDYGEIQRLPKKLQYEGGTVGRPATVGPGDEVALLAYRAEGHCFYRIDGHVVGTTCLPGDAERPKTEWWVETACEGAAGWVRVDRPEIEVGRTF